LPTASRSLYKEGLMGIQTKYIDKKNYLLVEGQGEFDINEVTENLFSLKQEVGGLGRTRIFLDCWNITAPRKEFDRFLFGKSIAELFPPPFRTALYFREDRTTKVSEAAATNCGANYLVSYDKEELLKWLLDDQQETNGDHS
jgi:hypothetical protein